MATLIGTDEAGYGPNFGPLVISATRWQAPTPDVELYELLAGDVRASPAVGSDCHVAIADSKQLYRPGGGLAQLERGVWAAAGMLDRCVGGWRQAWQRLAPTSLAELASIPWYAGFELTLPIDASENEIETNRKRLLAACQAACVELKAMESVAVFPDRFNRLVDECGTKGAALSSETLRLVRRMVDDSSDPVVLVQCDKHGGRNRYGPLLQEFFPEYLVEVRSEGRAASVYRWGSAAQRVEFRFVAKGESFLPAALASMASKYLRELAMRAFNAFWAAHLPDLRPTAGYPVDAARFRGQIQRTQQDLGIADHVLWRNR